MPVRIPDKLPAAQILHEENIFVMSESRALNQDIRPMKVLLLNLMPNKIETEVQILRLLSNSPLQVDISLLRIHDKESKHTPMTHMNNFYQDFNDVKNKNYDGLIITGAPLGHFDFTEVTYWNEIQSIIDWSQTHVTSVLFLCWAAHAGLYHLYNKKRKILETKRSGVFLHTHCQDHIPLLRGFDDEFYAPHSRYAEMDIDELNKDPKINVLASSEKAGAYIIISNDNKNLFVTGHPEYDKNTLKEEYERDLALNISPQIPENYFKDNDPKKETIVRWNGHGNLLISNWLNYYVYQITPYDLSDLDAKTTWEI